MPSVRHYLIVGIDARVVIHHRGGEDGGIAALIVTGGILALDPPGLAIEMEDIFAGL